MPRRMAGHAGTLPDGSANPISTAIRSGDFVFISGLMPKGVDGRMIVGDIAAQTHAVMQRLQRTVEEAGCTMDDVVKCTVWLTRAEDFAAFNAVYQTYFAPPMPARSAVRCDLLLPGALLELEAVCHRPTT